MRYEIRPLAAWLDGETNPRHPSSRFRASWSDTLHLLGDEAERLDADLVVLQLAVTEGDLRRDGMLRANAKVTHPGVVVSLDSRYGPLRYATDTYDRWQANVRAVALAMQALRAVDRWGVTKRGEQYAGWRAIEASAPAGFGSVDEALRWMREQAGPLADGSQPRILYRILARRMHPDAGGDPADWARLDAARRLVDVDGGV